MGPVSSPHTAASGKERTQHHHQRHDSSKLGKSDSDNGNDDDDDDDEDEDQDHIFVHNGQRWIILYRTTYGTYEEWSEGLHGNFDEAARHRVSLKTQVTPSSKLGKSDRDSAVHMNEAIHVLFTLNFMLIWAITLSPETEKLMCGRIVAFGGSHLILPMIVYCNILMLMLMILKPKMQWTAADKAAEAKAVTAKAAEAKAVAADQAVANKADSAVHMNEDVSTLSFDPVMLVIFLFWLISFSTLSVLISAITLSPETVKLVCGRIVAFGGSGLFVPPAISLHGVMTTGFVACIVYFAVFYVAVFCRFLMQGADVKAAEAKAVADKVVADMYATLLLKARADATAADAAADKAVANKAVADKVATYQAVAYRTAAKVAAGKSVEAGKAVAGKAAANKAVADKATLFLTAAADKTSAEGMADKAVVYKLTVFLKARADATAADTTADKAVADKAGADNVAAYQKVLYYYAAKEAAATAVTANEAVVNKAVAKQHELHCKVCANHAVAYCNAAKEAAAKAVADNAAADKAAADEADEADKVHVNTTFKKGALASTRTASTRSILMPNIAFFNGTLLMCCVLMLLVGNKLQIQSKDTLNQGCSMPTCHNRSMFDSSREMNSSAHMLTREYVLTKSWFLDVNAGGVADKATAEATGQASVIIDPGEVTLCGGPVSRLCAHDHNVVFGMLATANSFIVKSITCTCADSVGADPNTIAVGAIHKASAIPVGVVAVDVQPNINNFTTVAVGINGLHHTLCSKSAWEMATAYLTNEAYREAISWVESTQQKSSTAKWYCSLIKHEAFEVVNHNDSSSVWHLDGRSTSDIRSAASVGGVPAAHADPYALTVGTDTNAPAVRAVNPVEALSSTYAVTVNTVVRARAPAPVGDPEYTCT